MMPGVGGRYDCRHAQGCRSARRCRPLQGIADATVPWRRTWRKKEGGGKDSHPVEPCQDRNPILREAAAGNEQAKAVHLVMKRTHAGVQEIGDHSRGWSH